MLTVLTSALLLLAAAVRDQDEAWCNEVSCLREVEIPPGYPGPGPKAHYYECYDYDVDIVTEIIWTGTMTRGAVPKDYVRVYAKKKVLPEAHCNDDETKPRIEVPPFPPHDDRTRPQTAEDRAAWDKVFKHEEDYKRRAEEDQRRATEERNKEAQRIFNEEKAAKERAEKAKGKGAAWSYPSDRHAERYARPKEAAGRRLDGQRDLSMETTRAPLYNPYMPSRRPPDPRRRRRGRG